ncbi:MAG: hypothetical protein ICV76_05495 [Nitrospiraceae bacterium]|nr:hypothetical protein [Nitrospiraceae bacterium]
MREETGGVPAITPTQPRAVQGRLFPVGTLRIFSSENEDREGVRLGAPGPGGWNGELFQHPAEVIYDLLRRRLA